MLSVLKIEIKYKLLGEDTTLIKYFDLSQEEEAEEFGGRENIELLSDTYVEVVLPDNEMVFVNVYSITRHYGGAEEGGWWYNITECIETIPVRNKNSETMYEWALNEYKDHAYGDIYSVLGGRKIEVSIEGSPKGSENLERPIYE